MSTPASTPSSRRGQIMQTYQMAKRSDPRIGFIVMGVFLLGAALGFGLMWVLPGEGMLGWIISVVGALLIGALFALLVFGRRAQKVRPASQLTREAIDRWRAFIGPDDGLSATAAATPGASAMNGHEG